jgi:hypothetical protein
MLQTLFEAFIATMSHKKQPKRGQERPSFWLFKIENFT